MKSGFTIFFCRVITNLAGAQSNGPWNNPLLIATSPDGTNFTGQKIFQDSSGVPSIAKISGSNLIAAFQWFPTPLHSRH